MIKKLNNIYINCKDLFFLNITILLYIKNLKLFNIINHQKWMNLNH